MRLGDFSADFDFQGETVTSSYLNFDYVVIVPDRITIFTNTAGGSNDSCRSGSVCQQTLSGFWQVDKTTLPTNNNSVPLVGTLPLLCTALGLMALVRRKSET